jgi:hypothetical protein
MQCMIVGITGVYTVSLDSSARGTKQQNVRLFAERRVHGSTELTIHLLLQQLLLVEYKF